MKLLTESASYRVYHEWESVVLQWKDRQRKVVIGDFYGDPQVAAISPGERYCAMGGCGIIVYFLRAPFRPYRYGAQCCQWHEWSRGWSDGEVLWVEEISCLDDDTIEVLDEDGRRSRWNVHQRQI